MVLSVATEKIPSDTTGNRSLDRPTSSAVPEPLNIYTVVKQMVIQEKCIQYLK